MSKFQSQRRWRERNPEKVWAHVAFKSALRRGLIVQQPCTMCGDPKSEGHHPDYSRPAYVIWLCRPCHKRTHKKTEACR